MVQMKATNQWFYSAKQEIGIKRLLAVAEIIGAPGYTH